MAKEIAEEYTSSLSDLTLNSKPLINMLTMLADDNIEHAEAIVEAVEKHLEKVRSEYKLPVLYLIDSIVKNVGRTYTTLFTQNIVNTFCSVFEKVDEKVRSQMFKLRQTWNDVFPAKKMYALDIRVQCIDPAWPLTAPPPTPNIHVNPLFLSKSSPSAPTTPQPSATVKKAATVTVPVPVPVQLDPVTLDMQSQVINKQKELLELKQKKLELELLQAKAKLEEQQKQLEKQSIQMIKTPAQPLLKPEVAKQLASSTVKIEEVTTSNKTITQPLGVKPQGVSPSGPRIAPVSSALVASVQRPAVRDPRLAGKPINNMTPIAVTTNPLQIYNINSSNNINVENNYIKNKNTTKPHNIKQDIAIIDIANNDNKLAINNKISTQPGTLNRKDPRLRNNIQGPSNNNLRNKSTDNGRARSPFSNSNLNSKNNTTNQSSSSLTSSNSNKNPTRKTSSTKSSTSSSRTFNKGKSSSSGSGKQSSKGGSGELSTKTSSTSSPSKYKKKSSNDHSSPRSDKSEKRNSKNSSKSEKRSRDRLNRDSGDKYDNEQDSVHTSPTATGVIQNVPPATPERAFKELKGSTKNRNYIRRNRTVSVSPEPTHDVDLRIGAPPEKQPRLQITPANEDAPIKNAIEDSISKDVDLRTFPAAIIKKRTSTENLEHSPAKKSKTEIFDDLFGNEDVDLRQPLIQTTLATAITTTAAPTVILPSETVNKPTIRPPTPPPPIISIISGFPKPDSNDTEARKTKETKITSNPHFEALRAKLANATKMSAVEEQKAEDTDMRLKNTLFGNDVLTKIIISQAEEQKIKTGDLSQALIEKVLTLFETQKLQEAQRRESEKCTDQEKKTDGKKDSEKCNDLGNVTLTPISDDELSSAEFSHSSDSEDASKSTKDRKEKYKKKDNLNRLPPPAPVISKNSEVVKENLPRTLNSDISEPSLPQQNVDNRLPRMPMDHPNWHHHRRRRNPRIGHWDNPPQGPEPWVRPPPILNPALYGPKRPPFAPYMRSLDNFRMDLNPNVELPPRTNSPPYNSGELPLADPLVLDYIEQDTMRTINIDGRPREIRYYDETAIVIMSWDDPREISFQSGSRVITFDDKESFTLSFNDTYREVSIGGKPHRIRLGAPTRELYIDDKWYECFFGGPGIGIPIDGQMRVVKLDGPPPHVKIGTVKRTDLVAGKINLIINARQMVPVFLDAKPQKFDIEGKLHTLRFVDALKTVLINDVPFKVEFGGLPKPITVHDKKHFIRFSVLPKGIKPGYVNIANMEGERLATSPKPEPENPEPIEQNPNPNEPALPMLGKKRSKVSGRESPDSNRNSPTHNTSSQLGQLDVLSSIITSPMTTSSNMNGYQIDVDTSAQDSQDSFPIVTRPVNNNEIPGLAQETTPAAPLSFLPSSLNINELFQKLVASGIVTSVKESSPQPPKPVEEIDTGIKPVLFTQPETLKVRQPALVKNLFSGQQCSSCGVRFPLENSMQYSQHLDWHFRQNRRGRNSARKALCRKWYYNVDDWKNFEEIEDIEEREKNWFESQQQQQQIEGTTEDGEEEIEIPSVPADKTQDESCEVCHDKFDQFYNEEKEEWHLKMAIRVDGKTYHPVCYEDYKSSLLEPEHSFIDQMVTDEKKEEEEAEEEMDEIETKEEPIIEEENEECKSEVKDEHIEEDVKDEESETTEKEELNQSTESETKDDMNESDEVQIVTETIEEIIIDDKTDSEESDREDDEDSKHRAYSPDFDSIDLSKVVIKQEPIDEDELMENEFGIKSEPIDDHVVDISVLPSMVDNTQAELVSSIDGNVQLDAGIPISTSSNLGAKIKINITKPIVTLSSKEVVSNNSNVTEPEPLLPIEPPEDSNEPLPPGEEPIQLNLKPALQGLKLTRQPTVKKGTELTGMCSIM